MYLCLGRESMGCTRRGFVSAASAAVGMFGLAACTKQTPEQQSSQVEEVPQEQKPEEQKPENPEVDLKEFEKLTLDTKAWKYDKENDVYYQLGVRYCLNPVSDSYGTLAIFVPGAYLAEDAEGKKGELVIKKDAKVGEFTPATAPVLMPINPGNLGPQASPTTYSYTGLANYLKSGCVYVYAGFRGRSSGFESGSSEVYSGGAPWQVVDLKAAVRFLRYNAKELPCDVSRVFIFGFSGGGGLSALMGCSGNSKLYDPYLEKVGAATHDAEGKTLSDAIFGSAMWCPVTSFDTADASYEWMMGQYSDEGTRAEGTWTKLFANDLARDYATYINEMDLRDADDQVLVLDETSGDLFADGSYYAYMLERIQESAAQFFSSTQFPYTYTPQHLVDANFPGDPNLQSLGAGKSDVEAVTGDASAQAAGVSSAANKNEGKTNVESVVYDTEDDYVDDLNADSQWLTYNQTRATVRISSISEFVRHQKSAAKSVGAFDAPDRSTVDHQLFGLDEVSSLHFSKMMCDRIAASHTSYATGTGWNEAYVKEWAEDLKQEDTLKSNMMTRMNMVNPLYFLSGHYEGFATANVAPHWRINSGLFQTDTSFCTEMNLALALQHYEGVSDVALNPIWGQGHVLAEASGTVEENLLAWIVQSCK